MPPVPFDDQKRIRLVRQVQLARHRHIRGLRDIFNEYGAGRAVLGSRRKGEKKVRGGTTRHIRRSPKDIGVLPIVMVSPSDTSLSARAVTTGVCHPVLSQMDRNISPRCSSTTVFQRNKAGDGTFDESLLTFDERMNEYAGVILIARGTLLSRTFYRWWPSITQRFQVAADCVD